MTVRDSQDIIAQMLKKDDLSENERKALAKSIYALNAIDSLVEHLDFLYYKDCPQKISSTDTHVVWHKRGANKAISNILEFLRETVFDNDDRMQYGL